MNHPDRVITLRCWDCKERFEIFEGSLRKGINKIDCPRCEKTIILEINWNEDEEEKITLN